MLLNETNAAQAELSQLGKKYADLLGHQNHRQKIRHVVKINEENATLKQVKHLCRQRIYTEFVNDKHNPQIFYCTGESKTQESGQCS